MVSQTAALVAALVFTFSITACGVSASTSLPADSSIDMSQVNFGSQPEGSTTPVSSSDSRHTGRLAEAVIYNRTANLQIAIKADQRIEVQSEDYVTNQAASRTCALGTDVSLRVRNLIHQLREARVPQRTWDCPMQDPETFTGLHVARVGRVSPAVGPLMFLLKKTSGEGSCGDFQPVDRAHQAAANQLLNEMMALAKTCLES